MKRAYLTVYDYGMGGLWAYVRADSKAQIEERFPELTVFDPEPESMTQEELRQIAAKTEDLDHPDRGVLAAVLRLRAERAGDEEADG